MKKSGINNNIFLDSSILIEYIKQSKIEIFESLIKNKEIVLHINSIVMSEFIFYLIAYKSNRSPLSCKEAKIIPNLLKETNPTAFLSQFSFVNTTEPSFVEISVNLMEKYNLLPNDALILATCIINNISCIASYDKDFIEVCEKENILLINDVEKINQLLSKK